jgi:hypothetical protein
MPKLCGMERRQMSMYKNTEDASNVEKIFLLNIFHNQHTTNVDYPKIPQNYFM